VRRQIGAIVGPVIILALGHLCIDWIGAKGAHALWTVGLMWLALTLTFEFAVGLYVFGYSWPRMLAHLFILGRRRARTESMAVTHGHRRTPEMYTVRDLRHHLPSTLPASDFRRSCRRPGAMQHVYPMYRRLS
jgi:hypothetical protein